MSDNDDQVRHAVEQLVPPAGTNDWPDVLRRMRTQRRFDPLALHSRARRPVVGLLAVLVVAVPAVAATRAGSLSALWSHDSSSVELTTKLEDAHGAPAGTVAMRLPGVLVTNEHHHLLPHAIRHAGSGAPAAGTFRLAWRVELTPATVHQGALTDQPKDAQAAKVVALLCRPCHTGDSGALLLTREQTTLLLNGRLRVTFDTSDGQLSTTIHPSQQHGLSPTKG